MPAIVDWNLPAARDGYRRIGLALDGRADPGSLARRLRAFGRRVGLPSGLAAAGVGRDLFEALADRAMADLCMTTNPRPMTRTDVIAAYDRSL